MAYTNITLQHILNIITASLKRKFHRLFFLENWNVYVINENISNFLAKPSLDKTIYKTTSSCFNFHADPCIISDQNCIHLFIEKLHTITNIGTIIYQTLSPTGELKDSFTISGITKTKHLSFPSIIEENGICYMIPECIQSNRIAIYEVNKTNGKCSLKNILLENVKYVDIAVHKKGNIYYIFASTIKNCKDTDLDLFYTDNLITGKLTEHPCSPIRTGNYGSRMSGGVFELHGDLIRPGQFSQLTYGDGICLYNITALTKEEYTEELVYQICGKELGFDGLHTISVSGNFIAIDVKKHSCDARKLIVKLLRLIGFHHIYKHLPK